MTNLWSIRQRHSHIELIRQTDYRLHRMVNIYGCYFRSLLGIAESWAGKRLTPDQINELYEMGIEGSNALMTERCSMGHGAGGETCDMTFKMLDRPELRAWQMGSRIKGEKAVFFDKKKHPIHRTILWGNSTQAGWRHYRLGDEHGREIFDPDPTTEIEEEVTELLYMIY